MKLQPIKRAVYPNYAAALAALTVIPVLTGCGSTELQGLAPQPIYETQEQMLATAGEISITEAFVGSADAVFCEGFARQGITLEDAAFPADLNGNYVRPWLIDRENRISICFYSGTQMLLDPGTSEAAPHEIPQADWYAEQCKQKFDWGFLGETQYPRSNAEQITCCTAFVDIDQFDSSFFTADDAEQIAKALCDSVQCLYSAGDKASGAVPQ